VTGERFEFWRIQLQTMKSSTAWQLHLVFLCISSVVVLLAATMSIEGSQVCLPGLRGAAVPELCYFRRTLGIDCPGCGLTRSFIALAHGNLARAWHYNPAGILLFPFLAFQIPYQAAQLWRLQVGRRPWNIGAVGYGVFGASFLVMLVQWLLKMSSPA
jgi:hypothetical protein